MSLDDLGRHSADWVGTLSQPYAGAVMHELPPNGQGIATLIGSRHPRGARAGTAAGSTTLDTVHRAIEATKLALRDIDEYLADPAAMTDLARKPSRPRLSRGAGARSSTRSALAIRVMGGRVPAGPCACRRRTGAGVMISFIQSNYMGFGSGIVVPGTGISLQNRAAGFNLRPGHANEAGPGKRPFHTNHSGLRHDPGRRAPDGRSA